MSEERPPLIQLNIPKWDGLSGVKMGPGVMGRSSSVCMLIGAAGCAVSLGLVFVQWWAALIALGMTLGTILLVMNRAFGYIDKNTDQALLEGAQLMQKHRLDQQSAKDKARVIEHAPAIENTAPPKAISSQGGNNA